MRRPRLKDRSRRAISTYATNGLGDDDAEGPHVDGGRVGGVAEEDFGSAVGAGADVEDFGGGGFGGGGEGWMPCCAEVGEVGVGRGGCGGEEDGGGFDVAVDDAFGVDIAEGGEDVSEDFAVHSIFRARSRRRAFNTSDVVAIICVALVEDVS